MDITSDELDHYLVRLRTLVETKPGIAEVTRVRALETIEFLIWCIRGNGEITLLPEYFEIVAAAAYADLTRLDRALSISHKDEEEEVVDLCRAIVHSVQRGLRDSRGSRVLVLPTEEQEEWIARIIAAANDISHRLAFLQDDLDLREQAAELIASAEDTASRLQRAAGIGGDAQLAEHFKDYARRELVSANIFRGLAIAAIVAALALAAFVQPPESDDWVGLSYRVAKLLGIAALATYLGRQAAQHRRVFNWARSMQVQLQSFPAFIEPITDDQTRSGIYNEFARRVLGAPPEKGPNSDDAYPNQQVIELLTVLAKRAQ